jgi:hypothetical protein
VPAGITLKSSGPITLSKAGQVVSGLDITQGVVISASNVTLENSRIHGVTSDAAIVVSPGLSGVVIQHVEIDGGKQKPSKIGIRGSGFTVIAANIHGTGDGVDAGDDVTVKDSYIHDLWVAPGDHTDGIQTAGSDNLLISHDTVDASTPNTNSALILGADLARLANTTVVNCLLDGGNYTVYAGTGGYDSGVISITNSRFGDSARYGPDSFKPSEGRTIIFTGNVWDATGSPLS